MNDIWIFPLEPLDGRYTKQWFDEIPKLLKSKMSGKNANVYSVSGKQRSSKTTTGAFLDFVDTNYWKSSQLENFILELDKGVVSNDAHLLFTDFWNPAIIQVAYIKDLLGTNWTIHGIAHAGAYDPSDILGLKMRKPWPWHFEKAVYYASDYIYFATEFHRNLFLSNLDIPQKDQDKAVVSGQPYNYLPELLRNFASNHKIDRIMWPHRYNDDKQPEIAEDLKSHFDVFITQKMNLTKDEYYHELAKSKVVFSCSLHENLGVSMIEGTLLDCIPIAPDRASYREIYLDDFLYPSEWTESYQSYLDNKDNLVAFIKERMYSYDEYMPLVEKQKDRLTDYINPSIILKNLGVENND